MAATITETTRIIPNTHSYQPSVTSDNDENTATLKGKGKARAEVPYRKTNHQKSTKSFTKKWDLRRALKMQASTDPKAIASKLNAVRRKILSTREEQLQLENKQLLLNHEQQVVRQKLAETDIKIATLHDDFCKLSRSGEVLQEQITQILSIMTKRGIEDAPLPACELPQGFYEMIWTAAATYDREMQERIDSRNDGPSDTDMYLGSPKNSTESQGLEPMSVLAESEENPSAPFHDDTISDTEWKENISHWLGNVVEPDGDSENDVPIVSTQTIEVQLVPSYYTQ